MEGSIKQTQIYEEKSLSMYETCAMQEGSMLFDRELQEGPEPYLEPEANSPSLNAGGRILCALRLYWPNFLL